MVNINLLSDERKPARSRRRAPGPSLGRNEDAAGRAWLLALILLGVVAFAGVWFLYNRTGRDLDREIAAAQKQADELEPLIQEVEQYQADKAELVHKIDVINQLKANQRGPVQIMDEISRALPELLWLTRLEAKSNTVTLQGEAFNTNAVAAFLENLDRVPNFQEPVLKGTQQRGPIYTFDLTFNYTPTPSESAASPGTGAAAAPAGPAGQPVEA